MRPRRTEGVEAQGANRVHYASRHVDGEEQPQSANGAGGETIELLTEEGEPPDVCSESICANSPRGVVRGVEAHEEASAGTVRSDTVDDSGRGHGYIAC